MTKQMADDELRRIQFETLAYHAVTSAQIAADAITELPFGPGRIVPLFDNERLVYSAPPPLMRCLYCGTRTYDHKTLSCVNCGAPL